MVNCLLIMESIFVWNHYCPYVVLERQTICSLGHQHVRKKGKTEIWPIRYRAWCQGTGTRYMVLSILYTTNTTTTGAITVGQIIIVTTVARGTCCYWYALVQTHTDDRVHIGFFTLVCPYIPNLKESLVLICRMQFSLARPSFSIVNYFSCCLWSEVVWFDHPAIF